jgi:YD repeat-containing protein
MWFWQSDTPGQSPEKSIEYFNGDAYDNYGNLLQFTDANGVSTTNKFGYNASQVIATIINAEDDETLVSNFDESEPDNANLAMGWDEYEGSGSINELELSDMSVDGGLSQRCDVNGDAGIRHTISGTTSGEEYTIEFYYFIKSDTLKVRVGNSTFPVDQNFGGLERWQKVSLNYTSNNQTQYIYFCAPSGNSSEFYIDNFRYYPEDALCTSKSFDKKTMQVISQTDENGFISKYEHDEIGRLIGAYSNNGFNILKAEYYNSKNENDGIFDPNDPNYVSTIKYYSPSYENDFSNEAASIANWFDVGDPDAEWYVDEVSERLMQDEEVDYSYLILQNPDSFNDIEMSFRCKITGESGGSGGAVFRYQDADNYYAFLGEMTSPECWKLYRKVEGTVTVLDSINDSIEGAWNDVRIICFEDNVQIYIGESLTFNENDSSFNTGRIGFYCEGDVITRFDDLSINPGSSLNSISFFDGIGQLIQTLNVIDENEDIISAIEYDEFKRPVKIFKSYIPSTSVNHAYDSTYAANADSFYSASGEGTDCGDYPFTETIYEHPFDQKISKIGSPGENYNISSGNSIDFEYLSNSSSDVTGYDANELYKIKKTNENNDITYEYMDSFGNTVANCVDPNGLELTTLFEYDIIGQLTKSLPPRAESGSSSPYNTEYSYNTLGLLLSKDTPDGGVMEYLYDKNNNLRFVRDEKQDEADQMTYYIYDEMNRVIETGVCSDLYFSESVAEDTLPGDQTNDDNEKIINIYDSGGYSGAHNLKGQMASTSYWSDAAEDWGYTYYSYDVEGNIEWMIQDMPGDGMGEKKTEYQYDVQGNIIKISFQKNQDDEFYIWYSYNNLGQLDLVFADEENILPEDTLVAYTYWPTGQIKSANYDNGHEVTYSLNPRDWIEEIDDSESLLMNFDYDSTGNITELDQKIDSDRDGGIGDESEYGYDFNYDNANRLVSATATASPAISVGYKYDVNGNLLGLNRGSAAEPSQNYWYYSNTNQLKYLTGQNQNNYQYDSNGNLIKDLNKNITEAIKYDFRNLPYQIKPFSAVITMGYDSIGNRIFKKHYSVDNF